MLHSNMRETQGEMMISKYGTNGMRIGLVEHEETVWRKRREIITGPII